MRRTIVAAVLAVAATGCATSIALAPGDAVPTPIHMPRAADLVWNGFGLHLDPTLVLWGHQTGIDVRAVVRTAIVHIEEQLHGPPTSVSIEAGSYWEIPSVGVGGTTDRVSGDVHISLDARSAIPVRDMLRTWLPLAMAHELHHSKRIMAGPGYGATLLDAIVTEGSAEAFVREAYPGAPAIPWVEPLPAAAERIVWRRARAFLTSPDDLDIHQAWFFGGGALPRWAGYRIGYDIVERFIARHPGETASDLATSPTARIFGQSGFAAAMAAR